MIDNRLVENIRKYGGFKSVGWVQSLFHRDETHRYPFKMVGYASLNSPLAEGGVWTLLWTG